MIEFGNVSVGLHVRLPVLPGFGNCRAIVSLVDMRGKTLPVVRARAGRGVFASGRFSSLLRLGNMTQRAFIQ
jgi:hypothetical protein